ncbi:MAG: methylated-DNA--[protein]-cysteine S-methyltransferase [Alcaligenaceae bacterium]|nr:methylated-DNA--[protein]-cysteine S-methyltransferase [Alcaligenaceae bacterium]
MTTTFLLERLNTPLGQMLLATDPQGRLRTIDWHDHEEKMHQLLRTQYPGQHIDLRESSDISSAAQAIMAYFEGDLAAIDTLETFTGGTDFQRAVWAALRTIPAGQTISYLELANRIGRPTAVRAVGMANGANPISIVVPCHRVIGSGNKNSLVGYSGGMQRKRWLLEHEKALQPLLQEQQAELPGL